MKETKSMELTPLQVEAQKKDAETRKGLLLPEAEKAIAKPNRTAKAKKAKPESKAKAKKEKRALIRERQREEAHLELLRKGWSRQTALEAALEGLTKTLELREQHIQIHSNNLKASKEILVARKQKAEESRKLLEEMGQSPPVEETTTQ